MTMLIVLTVIALVGIIWLLIHFLGIIVSIFLVLWSLRWWIVGIIISFYGVIFIVAILKVYREQVKPYKGNNTGYKM